MMDNPENLDNMMAFIDKGIKFHTNRTSVTKKLFGFDKNTRNITWEDISSNNHGSRDLVNTTLKNMGMRSKDPSKDLMDLVQSRISKLVDHEGSVVDPSNLKRAQEQLEERFMETDTGFVEVFDRKGRSNGAVSLAHFRKIKDTFLDKALSEVQIPLVPYKFGIPLRNFKGMYNPTADLVQNLGHLANNSELVRKGLNSTSPHTQLIGGGNGLLAITPDAQNARMVFSDLNIRAFKKDSVHTDRIANIRSLDSTDFISTIADWHGNHHGHSEADKILYSTQHQFLNIGYAADRGFIVKPKKWAYTPLVKRLYGSQLEGVDIAKLNPTQLAEYLLKAGANITAKNPTDYRRALDHVINEASQGRVDIGDTLAKIHTKVMRGDIKAEVGESYDGAYKFLLKAAANRDILGIQEALTERIGGEPIIEQTSQLNKRASDPLRRVLYSLRKNSSQLGYSTPKEGGFGTKITNALMGDSNISNQMNNLQKGLLAETIHGMGINVFSENTGSLGLEGELESIYKSTDINENLNVVKRLRELGFKTDSQIRAFSADITSSIDINGREVLYHNLSKLGEAGSLLLERGQLKSLSEDSSVHARILKILSDNVESVSVLGSTKQNEILDQMSRDFDIHSILQERFKLGRPFHPEEAALNPLNNSKYFVTPVGTDIFETLNMPRGELLRHVGEMTKRGFGVGDFVKGVVDPNSPLGPAGMVAQNLFQLTDKLGAEVGLGLNGQDQITLLRSALNFGLKRILPAYIGIEAYKNINSNLHSFGLSGFDDVAANSIANINLMGAGIKDNLGITQFSKHLISKYPGLDAYFHPRTKDEEKDYLFYGDEEVRQNRFRMIFSRDPLSGNKVDYVRPNSYRRWKSHWTEADNVDISKGQYSWLPNFENPLGAIGNLFRPNWEHRHATDRPYIDGGRNVGGQMQVESGWQINSDGVYGPLAIGSFGGSYNSSMTGGGIGDGSKPGMGQYPQGDKIQLRYHQGIPEDSVNSHNMHNAVAHIAERAREQLGIYGAIAQRMPFFPHEKGLPIQESKHAHSIGKLLWSGDYGESFGIYGEYLQRIIGREDQPYDAINDRPNNQPSWMPDEYHRGDPIERHKGNQFWIPGDAQQRSMPWAVPLKVRGSVLGGTEEEIIDSWLHPTKPLSGPGAEDIVGFGCVDTETEILTESGWKRYNEIEIGETILTLNHETGFSEWQQVENINKYEVENLKMLSLEGLYHSSLTTLNHRWPVIHHYQKSNIHPERFEREWTTSENLFKSLNRIILAAEHSDIPTTPTYTDSFVELVAWFWTEGSIKQKTGIVLYQSHIVNIDNVNRISATLFNEFGEASLSMADKRGLKVSPKWRKSLRNDVTCFYLNVSASRSILDVAPNKIVSTEFIKKLTKTQLELFIEVSVLADGKSSIQLGQKNKDFLGALELAAILVGRRVNIREYFWIYRHKGNERLVSEHVIGFSNYSQTLGFRKFKGVSYPEYSGIVWCPTVKNSTWCAKRNGKVFYTGNSRAHLLIQRQLNQSGQLVAAEESIYDPKHNISGTIDAIVREEGGGYGIIDIKTQGAKSWGHTPDKYIDQITAYMAITHIPKAHLVFVNRDNPQQTRVEDFDFDPTRWQNIINRIENARSKVNDMVQHGVISPFETYDLLARIEILARTSPDSKEFRDDVQYAEESGGFGGFERQRFQQALEIAEDLKKEYNLNPKRYGRKKERKTLKVKAIAGDGSIITDMGSVKLAGVKWDNQAFVYEDPNQVLEHYGVRVGGTINATALEGAFNPEVMADTQINVVIGSVNKRLIHSKYADPDRKARDPLSAQTVNGDSLLGQFYEFITHSDNMLTNKFIRNRTGLEQLERGEIYGTDHFKISDIWNTGISPTLSSIAHKNPLQSAVMSALVAGMFFKSKNTRMGAMAVAAILGASLSVARETHDVVAHKPWVPHRYKRQEDFDQYWDILKYIKEEAVADFARKQAKRYEGVDIDKLERSGKRSFAPLGKWAVLAISADRQAQHTMYGLDTKTAGLQDALSAIPRRHREIAEDIILNGTPKDKRKLYEYISTPEKRVLAKFLGRNAPTKPDLDKYFKHHFLPGADWKGWSNNVNLNDLKTRAAADGNMQIDTPSRSRLEKAQAYTNNISVPRFDRPTHNNIKNSIRHIIAAGGYHGVNVSFETTSSNRNVINVDADLSHDQTNELIERMK